MTFQARFDLGAAARAMGSLGMVLAARADPRWAELPAEAVALLDPLPPGPELVGALTELSRAETLTGRHEAAVEHAERALALAEELGLDRSGRALGYGGLARCNLGDAGGLDDLREAIALATQAGQGRDAAVLMNNLGFTLWVFEGPVAALEATRAGIAFAQPRGLAEMVNFMTGSLLDLLIDCGDLDQALEVAAEVGALLESSGFMADAAVVRAAQARILTLRGRAMEAPISLDLLESTSRGMGFAQDLVMSLGSSAMARAGLGEDERAAALLREIDASPVSRETYMYGMFLPGMVRTALAIGDRRLSEALAAGFDSRFPYTTHALVAVGALLDEARGDLHAAANAYADAVDRWQRFGVVPEEAFALLGQGRCLVTLGRGSEAVPLLQAAREIFGRLGAAPALAETDALLQTAAALRS